MRTARASLLHAVIDKAVADLSRGLVSRYFHIGKRRTSARLDELTWRALRDIAEREGISVNQLCSAIADAKPRGLSLSTAIPLGVLQYYREAATESSHITAGHGKIARWF